jgi:hypothetical protein
MLHDLENMVYNTKVLLSIKDANETTRSWLFSEVISKDKQVPGLWPPVDADLGLFTASFWV